MPILGKLRRLYGRHGHEVINGIPPKISGLPLTEFTYIVTKENQTTFHLGISPNEIYFFEHLFEYYKPRNIFIIGNSFGWSTLALSMLNPQARVLAIEAAFDPFTDLWIDHTNTIAQSSGMDAVVRKGVSPHDVSRLVLEHFGPGQTLDFVFIDGKHTIEQIFIDFEACAASGSPNTVYLFHDVLYWELMPGIDRVVEKSRLDRHVLTRTATGMVLLCNDRHNPVVAETARDFEEGPKTAMLYAYLRSQANR